MKGKVIHDCLGHRRSTLRVQVKIQAMRVR